MGIDASGNEASSSGAQLPVSSAKSFWRPSFCLQEATWKLALNAKCC
jgi:hypothetical protein